jgi:hypothetical protein
MATAGSFKKGEKRPNQGNRGPNKTTIEVREAIAAFANANVGQMGEWLNQIDDPAKRLDLFLRAIEYHIPKLARTEGAGPDGEHLHKVFGWQK